MAGVAFVGWILGAPQGKSIWSRVLFYGRFWQGGRWIQLNLEKQQSPLSRGELQVQGSVKKKSNNNNTTNKKEGRTLIKAAFATSSNC